MIFEGTILEAVLTNRLTGDFSGPVNAMVTTDVYSHNRQLLLIPQGSRILGETKKVAAQNQDRLAVMFSPIDHAGWLLGGPRSVRRTRPSGGRCIER